MGSRLWGAVRGAVRSVWAGVSLASHEAALKIFGARPTLSGVTVTERSALEAPAYFAGVRNISEDLATLPLIIYRRLGDRGRERDPDHPLYEILHDQPNEEMDAVQFVEMVQLWAMIRRNGYAEIVRRGDGQVVSLWPIDARRVTVQRFEGQLVYQVSLPMGERDRVTGLPFSVLRRDQVLHIKAFALDGVLGGSSVEIHQESIGLALALERYGSAFFGNDGTPGGVYESPAKLSDEVYARMKKELEDKHRGLAQAHRIALLEEGVKFHETTVPPNKAQFIDSQRFSTEVMARINRIAPHKISDLSRATFSNIEHQGIDYVVSSIRPWAVRWEKAIATQLMTREDRRTHFAEFLLDALLRGDSKTRADALAVLRQNGIINADEWRALENLNEQPDGQGKVYLVNGNMVPVDQAGQQQKKEPPAPGPQPLDESDAARLFRPLFLAAAERCVRREAAAVAKAAERSQGRTGGLKAFQDWATSFYVDELDNFRQAWMPLVVAVGEAIRGVEGPDLSGWADEFVRELQARRAAAALQDLHDAVTTASAGELVERTRRLADRWVSRQPGLLAAAAAGDLVDSVRRYLADVPGVAA
ncbi:MAG TPA: phage portal protein [Actinomycetes bacterium]|nr:phage portal protein [Actinomycetes bacterium]